MKIFLQNIFFVLLSFTTIGCIAQKAIENSQLDKKSEKWYKEATKKNRMGDSEEALKLYDKVIEKNPKYVDAYLMKGGIYFKKKNWKLSKEMWHKSITIDPEHNKEVYYSLALVAEREEEYKNAVGYMEEYTKRTTPEEKKYEKALALSEKWNFMISSIANPYPFDPKPLPIPINSETSEYTPGFSAEGDQIYFVRRINGQEDIMVANINGENYNEPQLLDEIVSLSNEGVFTISADGSVLIFTGCDRRDGMGSCDLYISRKENNGKWSYPINMGKRVNSVGWDSQPSLSADGKTLYFSSKRYGSIGSADIWVTTFTDKWSIPENIGGMINTLGHDETPYIHHDNKTLYFRSNGRVGMGNFDLYISRYDDELGVWGEPVNLGYPINTKDNEGGIVVSHDGNTAYFSSDAGKDNVDIYEFELYDAIKPNPVTFVKINVKDAKTGLPLSASISIDNHTNKISNRISTDNKGYLLYTLPTKSNNGFAVEKKGYLFYSSHFALDTISTALEPYILDISLMPIEEESPIKMETAIILENIFFEFGSSELKASSNKEIQRLFNLLNFHKELKIKIIGHTDNIGEDFDNLELSKERAKAVSDAIVAAGISQTRIQHEGKGETLPVATNETEEGREKNRRTEFILIK